MKQKIFLCLIGFLSLTGFLNAQEATLLFPKFSSEESYIYEQDADRIDKAAQATVKEQMNVFRNYYPDTPSKLLNRIQHHLLTWATLEEIYKKMENVNHNGSYLPDSLLKQYKFQYFEILFSRVKPTHSLMEAGMIARYTFKLDNEQVSSLLSAFVEISDTLSHYTDEQLFGNAKTSRPVKTLRHLRYHDENIQKALAKIDPATYHRIRDIDHLITLNVLTQKQFRRIVFLNYKDKQQDRERIWNMLDSANMTYDLDKNVALYQITNYLVDLKTAEETYWNDKNGRQVARHEIKKHSPAVIKRYFSLRPKKKQNNNDNETSKMNYLW